MRCYFNVGSKADISQLKKRENKKNTNKLISVRKQSGESMESVLKKKRKAAVGRICRKSRF